MRIIMFSDASDKAIGVVPYVVVYDEDGCPISFHFYCSTNKTIAMDKQSAHERAMAKWIDKHGKEYQLAAPPINRLELGGAVLAMTLTLDICRAINTRPELFEFYTDSQNVLTMLKTNAAGYSEGDAVRRKVRHILGHSSPNNWNHVETAQNPADYVTKALKVERLLISSLWQYGPPMLMDKQRTAIEYPVEPMPVPDTVVMAVT